MAQRREILTKCPLIEITLLHRAMRLELEAICALAESFVGKAEPLGGLESLLRRFEDFDVVFSSHSMVEDDFLFPALASRGCVTNVAAEEHEEESVLMRRADDALRAGAARRVVDTTVCEILRELKEKLSEHMLKEEEAIFPSLAKFSPEELSRLVGNVLGSRPAETLEATIRMELKHLETDLAKHVIATMCDVAKNTNLKQWLSQKFRSGAFQKMPSSEHQPFGGDTKHVPSKKDRLCPHYGSRAALLRAPCCDAVVCCRKCHDGGHGGGGGSFVSTTATTTTTTTLRQQKKTCARQMDQRSVSTMVCLRCGLEQPVNARCAECKVRVADYFCNICNHFIADGNPTFHCPYCNLCRRGHGLGVDYAHCMDCNLCVLLDSFDTHFCTASRKTTATTTKTSKKKSSSSASLSASKPKPTAQHQGSGQRCAVCNLPLFQSQELVVVLPCGHPKHASCSAAACSLCAANDGSDHDADDIAPPSTTTTTTASSSSHKLHRTVLSRKRTLSFSILDEETD